MARTSMKAFIDNIAETHVLAAGRSFIVVGPNVWGKSRDIRKALQNAKSQTGRKVDRIIVYDVQDDAQIDDMGAIAYVPHDGVEPYIEVGRFEGGVK